MSHRFSLPAAAPHALAMRVVRAAAACLSAIALASCSGLATRVVERGSAATPVGTPAVTEAVTQAPRGALGPHAVAGTHRVASTARYGDAPPSNATAHAPATAARPAPRQRAMTSSASAAASAGPAKPAYVDSVPSTAGGEAPTLSGREPPPRTAADVDVAAIAFDVPTAMTLERRSLIRLELRASRIHAADAGGTLAVPLRASETLLDAKLSGNAFVIEPVSAPTQRVATATTTEWLWLVTPTKSGPQHLHLNVAAVSDGGERTERLLFPTFQHRVEVGLTWRDRLAAEARPHAHWLWAALALALLPLLWLYARWRRKRRPWFHGRL